MSEWQTLYAVTGLLVFLLRRADTYASAVMAVNFAGSYLIGPNFLALGVLDLACVAVLLTRAESRVARLVAALYLVMLPVYIASWGLEWQRETTAILIELIGYAQIVVIADVGRGMGGRRARDRLPAGGRLSRFDGAVATRDVAMQGVAGRHEASRKIGGR